MFGPQQRNQRYCQPSCQAAADLRRLNGDADTLAQISAKMLNEAFYSYNKPRKVLIKKNEEPAPARMPSTPEELGCSEDKGIARDPQPSGSL